jgi:O-antigen ligase
LVLCGAVVAGVALVPSMLVTHSAQPVLAVVGLVVGLAIAVVPARAAGVMVVVAALSASVVLAAVPGVRADASRAVRELRGDRVTLSSPDRSHELHAGLQLLGAHPVTGVGPGHVDLSWPAAPSSTTTMHEEYVHNEYVQLMVEVGVPGLLLALAGLGAMAFAIRRARRGVTLDATAGGVAALVVLAVHSAFDFLWHIPVVPLVAAVIVGTLLARPTQLTDSFEGAHR